MTVNTEFETPITNDYGSERKLTDLRKLTPRSPIQRFTAGFLAVYSWSLVLSGPVLAFSPNKYKEHMQPIVTVDQAVKILQKAKPKELPKSQPLPAFPYRKAAAERAKHPLNIAALKNVPPSISIDDEIGKPARPVSAKEIAGWKTTLHNVKATPVDLVTAHIRLGEWEMGHDQDPESGSAHFRAVEKMKDATPDERGLAAFDVALSEFWEGAYVDAAKSFMKLTDKRTALPGYDRRLSAMWARHASACAGYHADHARLGIPEPPRLDPLCGAASLAACLRSLKLPYDRNSVLKNCRVTGEGSNAQDILDAAHKLGLTAEFVGADKQGVIDLPKPLVAYVEHDHFVAVIRADKKGVSYLCSDCGAWPGGRVDLTWKQWNSIDPASYVTVTKRGSAAEKRVADELFPSAPKTASTEPVLASTPTLWSAPAPVNLFAKRHVSTDKWTAPQFGLAIGPQLAFNGDLNALGIHLKPVVPHVSAITGPHVTLEDGPATGTGCGNTVTATPCVPPDCCHKEGGGDSGGGGSGSDGGSNDGSTGGDTAKSDPAVGASAGDPVNLATGEEEYTPAADISVYNPVGPSVQWQRIYRSLRGVGNYYNLANYVYECNDFGIDWSQNYNVSVYDSSGGSYGSSYTKYVVYPNGSRVSFTASAVPTAGHPVQCQVMPGVPVLVEWDYSASGNYYTITFSDRTKWVTSALITAAGINSCTLKQLVDRNGNSITFNYTPAPSISNWPLLSTITNQAGTTLLTINRAVDGSGNIVSVSDCYGRSVYYHVDIYPTYGVPNTYMVEYPEVDHVSQIVPTSTPNPPDRYWYKYQLVSNLEGSEEVPFLHTISVPSPTGTGWSTASINYDPNTDFVSSIVDANGNKKLFASVDQNGNAAYPSNYTKVTVEDAHNNVVYSYRVGYDNNMSGTTRTDGNGVQRYTRSFSDPNDPYRPSAITNGNGNTASFTWDQYGNLLTSTTARGTVTRNTWVYTNFKLGELNTSQTGSKTASSYSYYEPSGLPQSETTPAPGAASGSGLVVTKTFTYDNLGNVLTVTAPAESSGGTLTDTFNYTYDANYDANGNPGTYSTTAAIGQPLTITDQSGNITHYRYNAQADQIMMIDANSPGNKYQTTFNIDNRPLTMQFPATGQNGSGNSAETLIYAYQLSPSVQYGPVIAHVNYDESGAQIAEIFEKYGPEGELRGRSGSTEPFTITYDGLYRRATVTDGNGNTTKYYYNSAGYLDSIIYPGYSGPTPVYLNGTWSNVSGPDSVRYASYDSIGNITSRIDGNGTTTYYTYNDPQSLLTNIHYVLAAGSVVTGIADTNVAYDTYSRTQSISDSSGSHSYAYDDCDLTVGVQTSYAGLSSTQAPTTSVTYTYWPGGNRASMSYGFYTLASQGNPVGTFQYSYYPNGLLHQITNPFGEVSSWAYLPNSKINTQSLYNSTGQLVVSTSFQYNGRNFLTDEQNVNGSGSLLSEFGGQATPIAYDGIGDRLNITANIPGAPNFSGSTNYQYDAIGGVGTRSQLVSETSSRVGGYANSFSYDQGTSGAGNPTTIRGVTKSYNADNQDTSVSYDGNGNPLAVEGSLASYDPENRVSSLGQGASNSYDALDQRSNAVSAVGSEFYFYDHGVAFLIEDAAGNVKKVTTWGADGIVSSHTSGGTGYYTWDPLGNLCQKLDGNGNPEYTRSFDSYGQMLKADNDNDCWAGFGGKLGYFADSSGLYLLGHRYYDVSAGRFINRDPISYRGGLNLYSFTANCPVNRADPTGLLSTVGGLPIGGGGGGFGGGGGGDNGSDCCTPASDNVADAAKNACLLFMAGLTIWLLQLEPELLPWASAIYGCFVGVLGAALCDAIHDRLKCKEVNPFDTDNLWDMIGACLLGICAGLCPPWLKKGGTIPWPPRLNF